MRPLGILLILVAVVLGVAGVLLVKPVTFYSATAVVKVTRDKIDLPELKGLANTTSHTKIDASDAFFIETEIAVVKSDTTLSAVITQLKLSDAWGRRQKRGKPLELSQTSQLLKQRVQVLSGGGAGLIEVTALSEVPEEAAEIANAVAQSYCQYRADYRRRLAQQAMAAVAGDYESAEQEIAASRAKMEQAWQQLDPELQEIAKTNASTSDAVMRAQHARFSDSLLRYLAASNQFALFPTNGADADIIGQLKERVDQAKAELLKAEKETQSQLRRAETLKSYQVARFDFEKLSQRFGPLVNTVKELEADLRPQSQPPATIVEPAGVPTSLEPHRANTNQWLLPTAGVALLLGVALAIGGRRPKKAAA